MSYSDAVIACQSLGEGWRLPRYSELENVCNILHKQKMGSNFRNDFYWCLDEDNGYFGYSFKDFRPQRSGKFGVCFVRAVREIV